MREIKFRYWNGEIMLYDVGVHPFLAIRHENDEGELMDNTERGCMTILSRNKRLTQYTGLKDKNGKEIYEGDIVRRYGQLYTVDWYPLGLQFTLFTIGEQTVSGYEVDAPFDPSQRRWGFPCNNSENQDEHTEVIGNIYETPELLEVL